MNKVNPEGEIQKYRVVGMMSGTSLDGIDLADCELVFDGQTWNYSIHHAETVPYQPSWKKRLQETEGGSAFSYVATDMEYGHLLGRFAHEFIKKYSIPVDFIASHGHTIFHQPGLGITSQIGRGSAISAETGLPVVCDFRTLDVALGGQGAPLVPTGDKLLFGKTGFCLNIGGFSNISYDREGIRIAFDICPANIVLNHLVQSLGLEYDDGGEVASTGSIQSELLEKLNRLPYYQTPPPKSLGKEWVIGNIYPLLDNSHCKLQDLLRTFCEHIAVQVAEAVGNSPEQWMMITGGGALNTFLVERIKTLTKTNILIPDEFTVNYKEALIFAFLGVLRWRGETNILRTVTGAKRDSCAGCIY